jgi:uncharacterized membrane protein
VDVAERRHRISSIDVLRGIVMILMALDHVRDFFGLPGNPTDPARASVALFFTRWITHLCAPTFFFLTGTSAYLAGRGRPATALSRFLLLRGVWLIALELTIIRCLGYQFNVDYRVTFLIILWALGWSMIALSALIFLPMPAIAAFGVGLIAAHNAFDTVRPATLGAFGPVWRVLHVQGVLLNTPRHLVFVAYPLIPWIGVTAAGYALGPVFQWSADDRQRILRRLGAALAIAFVVVRAANVYGDRVRWTTQASPVRTLLSFLNATKYPPSLLYLLMTLGPAMLLLARFDRRPSRWLQPALTFGRVPMFYFVLHLPAIHALATAVCYLRYGDAHWMFESPSLDKYPFTAPPAWGYSLPVVYAIWIGLVVALYPVCRWYANVKQRRHDAWLKYL